LRKHPRLGIPAQRPQAPGVAWHEESRYDRFEILLVADEMLRSLGPVHLLSEGAI
jgi:hypothetical protein